MKKRWQGFTEPGINWEENEDNFVGQAFNIKISIPTYL